MSSSLFLQQCPARLTWTVFDHHHHHVVLVAWISLTLSHHFSLSFIAPGRSSEQHPVSSHSCWMYVRAGRPAFARPCVGVHKSTSLMSSSLLKRFYYKTILILILKYEQQNSKSTQYGYHFLKKLFLKHLQNDLNAFKINSSEILFYSSSITVLWEPIFGLEVAFI